MLFQSLQFLLYSIPVFFLNLLFTNYLRDLRSRKFLLIGASAVFYMSWNVPLFSLLATSILLNYLAGNRIYYSPGHRKLWIALGVAAQLGILAVFKYANFGIESAAIPAAVPEGVYHKTHTRTWCGFPA
jgi:alginate O-acetyltransferase complex protein AlgI